MIDARLYLPKDWCDDPDRCDEAGIPEKERLFKTNLELALLDKAIKLKLLSVKDCTFKTGYCDCFYF